MMKLFPPNKRIQTKLLQWFKKNARDLPWRKTRDPYAIWVSEIMLQQTQVPTVIPYYQRFLKSFPTIRHLARANLSEILKIWEGLGYYSRARNLHRASKIILGKFRGNIPDTLDDLLTLPGLGRYTAGAILSIAFNKEAPILDGNVKRVLSRLFAISGNPRKTEGLLWQISESLIPQGRANAFNQALMDLGSMICTPKGPQCPRCPLLNECRGKALGNPESYPSKTIKKRIPQIEAVSAVTLKKGKTLLRQRPPKGLLGGLWEFPNWKIEGKRDSRLRSKLRSCIKKEIGMNVNVKESIGTFQQTFSHFKLTLHVFSCEPMEGKGKGKWIPIKNLDQLAMSRIHRRITDVISEGRFKM
ncbi:MAG: A/G-specific adenine glycosylase [Deltaproteobacteria bacterium RBG_16_50_11]|nr:MAG: A/G-specific adenine glycosylase [Deltaproteobacteria bacterium RBG_16_50_11]